MFGATAFVLLVLGSPPADLTTEQVESGKAALRHHYKDFDLESMRTKPNRLRRIAERRITPDFVQINPKGRLSRAEYLNGFKSMERYSRVSFNRSEIKEIRAAKTSLVVLVQETIHLQPAKQSMMQVVRQSRSFESWVLIGTAWRMKEARVVKYDLKSILKPNIGPASVTPPPR